MSTQNTESLDCQEKVGLRRKLTGPPRLLLGKFKSREKSDSKRKLRRDKRHEDRPPNNDQQPDSKGRSSESSLITHQSPHDASELEEMESQRDEQQNNLGILGTLKENCGKENMENKAGLSRKMLSLLWCRGRKMKDSNIRYAENFHNNLCNSVYDNKSCDTNHEVVAHGRGKRNNFFLMWPVSKRSSVTASVKLGRQCGEKSSGVGLQGKKTSQISFKKIEHIFWRKKARFPVDQCGASETTHCEADDQTNRLIGTNEEEDRNQAQEIKVCFPETFTFSAEVSVNTNIDSGHIDAEQEIYPHWDAGEIVPSTVGEGKYSESRNEILQTGGVLDSSKLDINDTDQNKAVKNAIKCKPVITIERAYSSEEEHQEVSEKETPPLGLLVMNRSWQHLKINSLTNNTLHPTELSVSPELDHNRCNETILIQTAISMVHSAVCAAVEQFANEQQQNQMNLDRV